MGFGQRRPSRDARWNPPITTLLLLLWCAPVACAQRSAPAARLSVADMREDLAVFRRDFMDRDRSYPAPARAEAEARLARLDSALDRVTRVEFELALDRIVALADNGHTSAFAPVRASHWNRVPFRLLAFGEDFRVVRARAAQADLLGAKLVTIDGRPITQARDTARTLNGGTSAWRDRFVPFFLESPEQMHALAVAREAAGATYGFETLDGRTVSRRIDAEPAATSGGAPMHGQMLPELVPIEVSGWRTLLAPNTVPWSVAEPNEPFRLRRAPELDALMIDFRVNVDAAGRAIADFLAQVTEAIRSAHPRHLVLDMRLNGGGNLQTTRGFMKSLPTLVPGTVFVLTSPWTFSAAISSVGYVKQAAPARVTIVGEEAGDRLMFFAEGRPFMLSHSGAMILYASQRHDYHTGCRGYPDCHAAVAQYPIAVETLKPEIAAPWTIEAYRSGRDPAMEAVAAAVKRSR
jgi:hypothetical protein